MDLKFTFTQCSKVNPISPVMVIMYYNGIKSTTINHLLKVYLSKMVRVDILSVNIRYVRYECSCYVKKKLKPNLKLNVIIFDLKWLGERKKPSMLQHLLNWYINCRSNIISNSIQFINLKFFLFFFYKKGSNVQKIDKQLYFFWVYYYSN